MSSPARTCPIRAFPSGSHPVRSLFHKPRKKAREYRKEREEPRQAGLREISEYRAVRPVEPGLGRFTRNKMPGIEIFIEHRAEILRSPAQERPLQETLPGGVPGPKPGLRRELLEIEIKQAAYRRLGDQGVFPESGEHRSRERKHGHCDKRRPAQFLFPGKEQIYKEDARGGDQSQERPPCLGEQKGEEE